MKMKIKPIVFENPEVALVLTEEQAIMLGINPNENNQGELTTDGPWQIPVKFKALCVSHEYSHDYYMKKIKTIIFGLRTLNKITQHRYGLEGYVSINGKKHSACTSTILFTINNKLIICDVIIARINKN